MNRDVRPIRLLAALALAGSLLPAAGCGRNGPTAVAPAGEKGGYQINLSGVPPSAADKAEPDTVGIMFCLDVSGSMNQSIDGKRKLDISKEAMRQVFAQIGDYVKKNPDKKVKVGVCSFSDTARVVVSLAPFDQARLEQAVAPLQPGGSTAIGDAMAAALAELIKGGVETRAIIVMTDGENNRGVPPEQVVSAIRTGRNNLNAATQDTRLFLVAFDVNAAVFEAVKNAGAAVKESRDQKSLQDMLQTVTELALEKPS